MEEKEFEKINKLKAKAYDLLAAKQQIEAQLGQANQLIAKENQRLREIEIVEAKKKAEKDTKVAIKNSNIVVDSKGSKNQTPAPIKVVK